MGLVYLVKQQFISGLLNQDFFILVILVILVILDLFENDFLTDQLASKAACEPE